MEGGSSNLYHLLYRLLHRHLYHLLYFLLEFYSNSISSYNIIFIGFFFILYHLLIRLLSSSKFSYHRMAVRRDQGIETDARCLSFLIVFTIVIFVVIVIFILFIQRMGGEKKGGEIIWTRYVGLTYSL